MINNEQVLEVNYQSQQLSPNQIKKAFEKLLSGKPIIIQQKNFEVFQEIFKLLDNRDFKCFFDSKAPESPAEFYLSICFLKDIPIKFIETPRKYFQNISLRRGTFHLFLKHFSHLKNSKMFSHLNENQIHYGQEYLKDFTTGHFYFPSIDQVAFLSAINFNHEILSAFCNVFLAK